jgi:hypothetical protein
MDNSQGVVVAYHLEEDGHDRFILGADDIPEIAIDFQSPEHRNMAHMGVRFLLCGTLACFANTLANSILAAGGRLGSLTARATVEKEKDDIFRTRYSAIKVEVRVQVTDMDGETFEGIRDAMERGSLLTYSLEEGIEMAYEIEWENKVLPG